MADDRRRKLPTLFLVAALLTVGLVGAVDAAELDQDRVTTGHTTYVDASTTFNSCFAGVAGLVVQRVTWFNGQELFSRADSGGNKWIYVTQGLNDTNNDDWGDDTGFKENDPANEQLYRTNQTYKFNDPEDPGKEWIVREYFALREKRSKADTPLEDEYDKEATSKDKFYVFAVKVGEHTRTDSQLGLDYNFAMVVDTCRFHGSPDDENVSHNGTDGNTQKPIAQHDNTNESHEHDAYDVDIWVGGEPNALGDGNAQVPDDRDGNAGARNDTQEGGP